MRTGMQAAGALVALALLVAGAGCGDDDGTGGQGGTAGTTSGSGGGGAGMGGAGPGGGGGAAAGGGGTGGGSGGAGGSSGTTMGLPCNGNTCDLTFEGTGFGVDEGKTIYAGLVVQGDMGFVWEGSATIAGGAFSISGPGALTKGVSYNLNYYVDVDGNGNCEQNPTDHVWRLSVGPVQEHLTVSVVFNMTPSNIGCGGFP